jgi:potassium-transporting ATPase KdpC subunit
MRALLRPTLAAIAAFTVLTGVGYPLAVTGLARLLFPRQAEGSLLVADGRVRGSALVGQTFSGAGYFHGRPSATSLPYDAAASSGSNLGPSNPALESLVHARVAEHTAADGPGPVPVDLVTASASGLDPHVTPAAADRQVARVARVRGLDEAVVRDLVRRHTEDRTLGLLGEPRVNVLRLNLALDGLAAKGR